MLRCDRFILAQLVSMHDHAVISAVLNMQLPNSKKNLPDGCWWLDTTAAAAAGAVLPTVLQLPSVTDGAAAASGGGAPAGSGFSVQSGKTVYSTAAAACGVSRHVVVERMRANFWCHAPWPGGF